MKSWEQFLQTVAYAPARRHQSAQELRQMLQAAEAALADPQAAATPGYTQLLVNVGVAKQELQHYGV
jgi:hypothetical protein